MIRRTRVLAGTIALLLALGALGATAAQAVDFNTESENAVITAGFPAGEKAAGANEAFSFLIEKAYVNLCVRGKLSGAMATEVQPSLILTPALSECALPWSMGACDLVFDAAGSFDIAGTTCATEPMVLNVGCKIHIGPQENLSGITYVNEGEGSERQVRATLAATKVHYTQVSGFPCHGGLGTFNKGELTAIFILRAEDSEGEQKGLWIE